MTVTFMRVSWSWTFTKDLESCEFWFPKPQKKGFLLKLPLLMWDAASPWLAVHTGCSRAPGVLGPILGLTPMHLALVSFCFPQPA